MNRFNILITIAAFSLMVLGLPAIASAQYGGYDPYGRNGGYNNGRYGNNGNYGDMRSTVRNLKSRSARLSSVRSTATSTAAATTAAVARTRSTSSHSSSADAVNRLDSNGTTTATATNDYRMQRGYEPRSADRARSSGRAV